MRTLKSKGLHEDETSIGKMSNLIQDWKLAQLWLETLYFISFLISHSLFKGVSGSILFP